jgi:hypothetical protein
MRDGATIQGSENRSSRCALEGMGGWMRVARKLQDAALRLRCTLSHTIVPRVGGGWERKPGLGVGRQRGGAASDQIIKRVAITAEGVNSRVGKGERRINRKGRHTFISHEKHSTAFKMQRPRWEFQQPPFSMSVAHLSLNLHRHSTVLNFVGLCRADGSS